MSAVGKPTIWGLFAMSDIRKEFYAAKGEHVDIEAIMRFQYVKRWHMISRILQIVKAATMIETIDTLALAVKIQADRLFPDRNDQSMFLKMYGEISEMVETPGPDEVADVLILILDYAKRHDIDIEAAIKSKMAINDERRWETNHLGVIRHV